jgi:hypothetical protein
VLELTDRRRQQGRAGAAGETSGSALLDPPVGEHGDGRGVEPGPHLVGRHVAGEPHPIAQPLLLHDRLQPPQVDAIADLEGAQHPLAAADLSGQDDPDAVERPVSLELAHRVQEVVEALVHMDETEGQHDAVLADAVAAP